MTLINALSGDLNAMSGMVDRIGLLLSGTNVFATGSGARSTVKVTWNAINPTSYATPGTFTVSGTANLTNPSSGKGTTMTAMKATVDVT